MGKNMGTLESITSRPLLLLIAGVKGAIGSTMVLASHIMRRQPEMITPYLTTTALWSDDGAAAPVRVAGWDVSQQPMSKTLALHRVVPESLWRQDRDLLDGIQLAPAPKAGLSVSAQVDQLLEDINVFRRTWPDAQPVMINLLPACSECGLATGDAIDKMDGGRFPDLAYARAAIAAGIPVVNFTPNDLGDPALVKAAAEKGLPLVGGTAKPARPILKWCWPRPSKPGS
jgi:hypothetical protein